jgi:hypothetical protein
MLKCRECGEQNLIPRRILQDDDKIRNKALCLSCGKSLYYEADEIFATCPVVISQKRLSREGIGDWNEKQLQEYRKRKKSLIKKYGEKCKYCGCTSMLQVDHIFPKLYGGKTVMKNLQLLCHTCNATKRDNLIIDQPTF